MVRKSRQSKPLKRGKKHHAYGYTARSLHMPRKLNGSLRDYYTPPKTLFREEGRHVDEWGRPLNRKSARKSVQ
jgi:hypothetical protein